MSGSAYAFSLALASDMFAVEGGDLLVGRRTVSELARAYGTPLYIYDAGPMRRTYRRLSRALSGFASVMYSIKANPNPAIAEVLVKEGAAIEVSSAGELRLALKAGADATEMVAAGPGKTEADLRCFLANRIGEIHVESFDEVERLAGLAAETGVVQNVSIRVNPAASAGGGAMRMGSKPTAFGFDEEIVDAAVQAIAARPSLRLSGVHLFAGTQILDATVLVGQWRHGLVIAARIAALAGHPLDSIDLGGGLGIAYHPGESELDLDVVSAALPELSALRAADPGIAAARIVVEPGRYLVGPSGLYVVRVTGVKESRGRHFAVTDGGMHHHLAASGNLGQVVKRDYPVVVANRMDAPAEGPVSVVGPLCTPLDVLARNGDLPTLAEGDLVAVLQSGAYGLSASPIGFLSHDTPAELLVDEGEARLIRRRLSVEELFGLSG